jgi:tetratricopeptide (TPR) repeat protein
VNNAGINDGVGLENGTPERFAISLKSDTFIWTVDRPNHETVRGVSGGMRHNAADLDRIRLMVLLRSIVVVVVAFTVSSQILNCQTPTPEFLFQKAIAAQERGDNATAVNCYGELLLLRPEAVEIRVNLGVALAHEKHFSEAIEQYLIVLSHDPGNHFARMNLAVAYRDSGDNTRAMIELEEMHRADESDGQVSMMLADTYSQAGRFKDAIPLLSKLETTNSEDSDLEDALGKALIHEGRLEEGAIHLEKAVMKSSDADDFVLAGLARFEIGQYDLAQHDAAAAQQLNATQPGLATLKGMILQQISSYNEAESILRKAVTEDPNDFNANLYLGAVLYFKRDLARAQLYLGRALTLQPQSPQARYELALVKRANGDLIDALEDLKTVVKQAPDWLQPHVELSALFYRLHNSEEGAKERAIVDRLIATPQRNQ